MSVIKDVQGKWEITVPMQYPPWHHAFYATDTVESGPEVSVLQNTTRTTTNPTATTLSVAYSSKNPVTITWSVNDLILAQQQNIVRQGETSLRLNRQWFERHHNSRYKVTVSVYDQVLRTPFAVNPRSTSCLITVQG